MKRIFTAIILTASIVGYVHAADNSDSSTRKERNYIREGNSLYDEKRFADAEVAYRKALEENAMSETAMYNLAAALIRQSGNADPNSDNNPMSEAQSLLQGVAQSAQDISIAEKAFYNLGNMAFNQQQYDQAINMYKGALRKNPDNDKARENLRLAQLKRQEQQNQDQNQDKQDQQQNQDQNQDQQQNQDQDKDKDQNQDQDQQKQQNKDQQQPPQQQQGGISDANANKILKAMENEENATRRKVQDMQKKEAGQARRVHGKQW
ncbi:MAG TPA: tetratricopeptide repeat protein [Muribaculum sp.]|uniref:Tetratricopeptide repeat protein n=1 Tax=Heminiphilus faecis TaxID=2601703 RepID=A0ABV4CUB6_9BACT|nr:tetratricopeptide repeat protein [Heminiphilus faecis]RLT76650.1 tetratricopeptide repeat protein [bacterium J10(2018)]HRF67614.1 tetratricopeptide repeat protein [Muribaculum sp.]